MYNVTITFNVNGQIISRNEKDTTLLSDSIDLIKARFNFSPEWQGYTKTAIFKSDTKKPYSKILVDDACMVPPEAIKKSKYMSVSVFGVSGTQLITTTDQIVPLTPSGYTDDSIVSPAPTENIYQQIVTLMQKQAVDAVHAETAQEEAERAAVAAGLSETNAADSASQAALSVLGGGYVGMEIKSDGKLYCTRTRNLESTLNFALSNGRLEVQING